jgi:hypothetical protein
MSYNITLPCGCLVYISCHPQTGLAHTRVIERRSLLCGRRTHDVGVRLSARDLEMEAGNRLADAASGIRRRIPA